MTQNSLNPVAREQLEGGQTALEQAQKYTMTLIQDLVKLYPRDCPLLSRLHDINDLLARAWNGIGQGVKIPHSADSTSGSSHAESQLVWVIVEEGFFSTQIRAIYRTEDDMLRGKANLRPRYKLASVITGKAIAFGTEIDLG